MVAWFSSCKDDAGDLRFLSETVVVGPVVSAPGAVEAGSRFRLADWFGVFGSVYYLNR